MNYIKEVNAFYDWLETNSISDSSIVLWHALMHINNKTGWVREFAVAVSTLEAKTGLKKGAIMRARQRLQQMGRIDFRSRNGQMAAIYKIIYFDNEFNMEIDTEKKNVSNTESNCVLLRNANRTTNQNTNRTTNRTQTETQTGSITKLNKTKLNNYVVSNSKVNGNSKVNCNSKVNDNCQLNGNSQVNSNTAGGNAVTNTADKMVNLKILKENKVLNDEAVLQKIQKIFDHNIHPMTPVEMTDILDWLNKGFESEAIIAAINIAVRGNRRFMRYINGILMNWYRLGIKTAAAVDAHNREWQERYEPKAWIVNEGDGGNGANRESAESESYGAGIGFKV